MIDGPQSGIFTIGHSNLEPEQLLLALKLHSVAILGDVRSRPASGRFPQFNREPLEYLLREAGLRYEFLGEELGGRPDDPRAYRSDGLVDYVKRRESRQFQSGIERAVALAESENIALMCAEEDPIECHRFLLVSPALIAAGIAPRHIRRRGVLESQSEAEDRLLDLHGFADVKSDALFASGRDAALVDALRLQSEKFAFRVAPEALESF
jgi:uncharacterized protein (DUF488 family)